MRHSLLGVVLLVFTANAAASTASTPQQADDSSSPFSLGLKPIDVTFCDVAKDPAAYSQRRIRLTAFVKYGFEDFTIVDPGCVLPENEKWFNVWVTYGGAINSGAIYCCPGEGTPRSSAAQIDHHEVPLLADETFVAFRALLAKERDTVVKLTASGVFLAGRKTEDSRGTFWQGYGHMGMGSLFVLQQVEHFDPHTRMDLDYSADGGWYEHDDLEKPCSGGWTSGPRAALGGLDGEQARGIAWQAAADHGNRRWSFNDAERVARDAVDAQYGRGVTPLMQVTQTPARQIFQWKRNGRSIVVVLTRPYWLSFFAESGRVAWMVTMITDARCG